MSQGPRRARDHEEPTIPAKTSGHITGIPDAVFKHPAFRALSMRAKLVVIGISHRLFKYNNGEITFSIRMGFELLNLEKATTSRALHEAEEAGFIVPTMKGTFTTKRRASQWEATWASVGNTPATHLYKDIWEKKLRTKFDGTQPPC